MKRAIITGITGQDGSYLTELLLAKDYEVHGLRRPHSAESTSRLDHLINDTDIFGTRLFLHYGDLFDRSCLHSIIQTIQPHEFYHLAAQSHVGQSFVMPEYTAAISGQATKANQQLGWQPKTPFKELVQSMVREDLRREGITDMLPALSQSDGTPEALSILASTAA